jgi:hypothetical protein
MQRYIRFVFSGHEVINGCEMIRLLGWMIVLSREKTCLQYGYLKSLVGSSKCITFRIKVVWRDKCNKPFKKCYQGLNVVSSCEKSIGVSMFEKELFALFHNARNSPVVHRNMQQCLALAALTFQAVLLVFASERHQSFRTMHSHWQINSKGVS